MTDQPQQGAAQAPPAGCLEQFPTEAGLVALQWPGAISESDIEDVVTWLALVRRKMIKSSWTPETKKVIKEHFRYAFNNRHEITESQTERQILATPIAGPSDPLSEYYSDRIQEIAEEVDRKIVGQCKQYVPLPSGDCSNCGEKMDQCNATEGGFPPDDLPPPTPAVAEMVSGAVPEPIENPVADCDHQYGRMRVDGEWRCGNCDQPVPYEWESVNDDTPRNHDEDMRSTPNLNLWRVLSIKDNGRGHHFVEFETNDESARELRPGDIVGIHDQHQLSPSEALFGFIGMLSSLQRSIKVGSKHNAGYLVELVNEFCDANSLPDPRDGWDKRLIQPGRGMDDRRPGVTVEFNDRMEMVGLVQPEPTIDYRAELEKLENEFEETKAKLDKAVSEKHGRIVDEAIKGEFGKMAAKAGLKKVTESISKTVKVDGECPDCGAELLQTDEVTAKCKNGCVFMVPVGERERLDVDSKSKADAKKRFPDGGELPAQPFPSIKDKLPKDRPESNWKLDHVKRFLLTKDDDEPATKFRECETCGKVLVPFGIPPRGAYSFYSIRLMAASIDITKVGDEGVKWPPEYMIGFEEFRDECLCGGDCEVRKCRCKHPTFELGSTHCLACGRWLRDLDESGGKIVSAE